MLACCLGLADNFPMQPSMSWQPITPLSAQEASRLANQELPALFEVWQEQRAKLQETGVLANYTERLRREIAIETGILERLYSIDRGITTLLIEQGIDEALIPHGATNIAASKVISLIRDQKESVDSLFDFVKNERQLSTSYIKELHQLLTRNQASTEALESTTGRVISVDLLRGMYKKSANNPLRADGSVHVYAPPEHVAAEMDNLLKWYQEQHTQAITPEVSAAWLHHRFTQIHPFQDGNGRVARCLAILVFIKAGWFPLSIKDSDRVAYIDALEIADEGDLAPLVDLFVKKQRHAFVESLSLSEQVLAEKRRVNTTLASISAKFQDKESTASEKITLVKDYAASLEQHSSHYLKEIAEALTRSIAPSFPEARIMVQSAASQAEKTQRHRFQVTTTAKALHYFANLHAYHHWLDLIIDVATPTHILISFHGLGRNFNGILACNACAYHRDSEDNGSSTIHELRPLSDSIFQFSYADEEEGMKKRFVAWLEDVVVAGLEYWNQSI